MPADDDRPCGTALIDETRWRWPSVAVLLTMTVTWMRLVTVKWNECTCPLAFVCVCMSVCVSVLRCNAGGRRHVLRFHAVCNWTQRDWRTATSPLCTNRHPLQTWPAVVITTLVMMVMRFTDNNDGDDIWKDWMHLTTDIRVLLERYDNKCRSQCKNWTTKDKERTRRSLAGHIVTK